MKQTSHTLQLLPTRCINAFFGIGLGLLMVWCVGLQPAVAADYQVTPLVIDLSLAPRDIVNEEITIKSEQGAPLRLFAAVNQVSEDDDKQLIPFVRPANANSATDVTSWIAISRGRIALEPGGTVTVPLTIKVSPQAEPGNYLAFVGFPAGSNQPQAYERFMRETVPGVLVRIEIKEQSVGLLRLSRFYVDRFLLRLNQGAAAISIANVGTKATDYKGEIIYYNARGVEIASQPITSSGELQENENRDITIPVPESLSLGKYKAHLSLSFGNNQSALLTDTVFFYVVPIQYILLMLGGLLVTILFISYMIHRRYRMSHPADFDDEFGQPIAMVRRAGQSPSGHTDVTLPSKK